MKKELIGPGLHLRPVRADPARPPLQWTLNSLLTACGNDDGRIRPPPDRGTCHIQVTHRLRENRHQSPLPPDSVYHSVYRNVTTGLSVINWLECNCGLIGY